MNAPTHNEVGSDARLGPLESEPSPVYRFGDAPWSSQVMRTALHAPLSPEAALALPASTASDARPLFILIVTGVFCLFGVVSLVSTLLGMGAGSIYAGGGLIERYPQAVRVGTVVNGVMLLACAYGIYRRYLCADLHGWVKFVSYGCPWSRAFVLTPRCQLMKRALFC